MSTSQETWGTRKRLGATLVVVGFCTIGLSIWPSWPTLGIALKSVLDATTLGLVIPAVVVVVGWLVGHRLSFAREVAAKRRETRLECLESAFMVLHASIARSRTPEQNRAIEVAVGRMQLYGTPTQLVLFDRFADEIIKRDTKVPIGQLLVELQNNIRGEIGLPPVSNRSVAWVNLYDADNPSPDEPQVTGRPKKVHVPKRLTRKRR